MNRTVKWINFETKGKIPPDIEALVETIEDYGGEVMLVGGGVLDLLEGKSPTDWDLEVFYMDMEELSGVLTVADYSPKECGKEFGILKLKAGDYDVDVSIPRRENSTGGKHHQFDVTLDPSMTPFEAARRRDFTINSMYYCFFTEGVCDPFGGLQDWEDGLLRMTSPDTFMEDPLRALRAMQLLARKCEEVDERTLDYIMRMRPFFKYLPGERLMGEWEKLLLKADKPSKGLDLLYRSGWLEFFPELLEFAEWSGWFKEENGEWMYMIGGTSRDTGCPQNPEWHPEGNVWIHTLEVVDEAARVRRFVPEDWRLAFMFAALLHDVAKPLTTVLPECTAYGHEAAGEELTRQFMERLCAGKDLTEKVVALVVDHLKPFALTDGGAKPAAWKRLQRRVRLDVLGWLSRADWAGRPGREACIQILPLWAIENGEWKRHEPSRQCFRWHLELGVEPIKPIVTGKDLIALGHKPGKIFGEALKAAFEEQIDNPEADKDVLVAIASGAIANRVNSQ